MKADVCTFAFVTILATAQVLGDLPYEDPCKLTNVKTTPHVTHCDRYYACYHGQPLEFDCPNGLVYVGKGQKGPFDGVCDYDFNVDCTGREKRNAPISTEHCDWLYGIFGHETSCTRYWTCWNGTATEQLCIGGLLYNENTHSCDWPDNVEGCQKHPLCNADANGNVPLGKSCNRYWQCQGGYPRLQRCPAMLVFDRRSLRCVVPPTEDCEVPTTQPPLPDELEQDGEQNIPNAAPRPNLPPGALPLPVRNRPRN
ncbi:peritrophin-1 isoform X1 [Cryptotermes secundus]|uniref:peritrophin-1 isoform X1 n=1 Tax=Cryptotermes secundus TaxID=105785 RepID=UPI000CD7B620|nr:peritrophin-1 isoform X1 [Cryptotermes secundus]